MARQRNARRESTRQSHRGDSGQLESPGDLENSLPPAKNVLRGLANSLPIMRRESASSYCGGGRKTSFESPDRIRSAKSSLRNSLRAERKNRRNALKTLRFVSGVSRLCPDCKNRTDRLMAAYSPTAFGRVGRTSPSSGRVRRAVNAEGRMMAKRPKPGKCVHCLKDPVERNWDHVLPKSWYPDTSPADLYKWQIPSCIPCNSALGAIEEEFLRLVSLGLDPTDKASRSIVEKSLRSMNPDAAESDRDRNIRAALRRRVRSEILQGNAIPQDGTYPGMGEKWGRRREEQVAIPIPADSVRRIAEKIIRGIFYVEDGKFIDPPYTIDFFPLDPRNEKYIREPIDRFGKRYCHEPGIMVGRVVAPEDGMSSLFEIVLWRQFKMYASVEVDKALRLSSIG
jgi:hypothetical protein